MARIPWLSLVLATLGLVFCGGKAITLDGQGDSGVANTDSGTNVDDLRSCTDSSQCVLASPGCCGLSCSASFGGATISVRADAVGTLKNRTCSETNPACPDCLPVVDPNLLALCRNQKCTTVDLRAEPVTSCTTDSDCVLMPAGCCAACGTAQVTDVVAVRKDQTALAQPLLCKGPVPPCPACPTNFSNLMAFCSGDHHCKAGPLPVN